jgi:hypothetical protein
MRRDTDSEVQGRRVEYGWFVNEAAGQIKHVSLLEDDLPGAVTELHIGEVITKRQRERLLVDSPHLRP